MTKGKKTLIRGAQKTGSQSKSSILNGPRKRKR